MSARSVSTKLNGKTRSALRRIFPDQRGNVAIVWALMATVLMLAVGAAIDVGRWLHARDQTAAAVDAALLAGGRALQANATDEGAAIAAGQATIELGAASIEIRKAK